jgi:hypothetical protein
MGKECGWSDALYSCADLKRILSAMDKYSYPNLQTLRKARHAESSRSQAQIVPFGPVGGGQWTGHFIGLFIAVGFILIALVGVPESRPFFALSLSLGSVLGFVLWLWHRSNSPF